MKKRILAAALLVSGLTVAAGPVAQAAQEPAPSHTAARQALMCTVNDNGVNFRGGPGTEYPVLGQVNRGQQFDARGQQGDWVMGDVVGGRTGVWIHVAYLDC
ncbi:SH3 domain-containing protein [Streptomyces marokkonensis]|uniref:SH3 domain-containing protein n=1 Tax=Streptomyces marokkonensis TaxID=324855 RepID=UPI0011F1A25B|nr:SH3 domain-containing protein [Streptomyces marokkonensis]